MGDVSDHGILKAVEAAIRDKSMHWFMCVLFVQSLPSMSVMFVHQAVLCIRCYQFHLHVCSNY